MSAPKTDRNSKLMLDMGSKTGRFDPEPPDQWLYVLKNGAPEERAIAWIKSKTIARSHSPFCADEHGKALHVENMAADLGWKVQTARNVLAELVKQGRVRVDEVRTRSRIFLRADVPISVRRTEGDGDNSVQTRWSPYIYESIESLSEEKRAWILAQEKPFFKWQEDMIADALIATRRIIERIEDSMLRRVGIEKKRLPPRTPKRVPAVQLSLLQVPEFVQSYGSDEVAEFVQSAQSGSYKPESGSVQIENLGASLYLSDSDPDSTSVSQSERAATDRRTHKTALPSNPSNEDAVAEMLTRKLAGVLQEIPKPKLCADIVLALNGAPIELLARKIEHVLSTRPQTFTSMGLAELLARDVAKAWQHGSAARQRDAEAREVRDRHTRDQELSAALKTLDDPNASDTEKEIAREILSRENMAAATAGGAL